MDIPQQTQLPSSFTLADGRSVTIRLMRPSDAALLVDLFHHLSERSKRLRFHAYTGQLPQERIWREAVALSDLDPQRQAALVAVLQDTAGEHIVAVARLARAAAADVKAEAAVVVRDDLQRMGLGTHLLMLLVPLARSMGIQELYAWVMAENRHMLQLLQKTSLPTRSENQSGELLVSVSLIPPG
jgi:acetyltransferase